ncbi:amino acid ABC transporter permease [Pseudomonas laurentiana]|uniref:Amino acid permease n=1 Tax=Pseudomonas laurentiana TaxID=2364649 RepID=A0A6I5RRH5_9PSED|nr:amino acid permease [Pseudomonas laurentiana]NES10345.1 amino acid permease [Pseudomonas laurentiana]GGU75672.1 amino acid ABC transporter permease [Pseudomonas laurentiana]
MTSNNNNRGQRSLKHGLTTRQVSMISIAGIIGAGLFIGSSNAIATAGPAILISYALTGLLVLLVMRMLGEMAVANPNSGSFSTYAGEAIGPWAGFTIGWLYWWFWVLIIPVEAIAGADILHAWYPAIPSWAFTFLIMITLSATNLISVRNFGTFEYWFALIKIIAILAFIGVCSAAVLGYWPLAEVSGVGQLLSNGGFMPNGFGAVLGGILVTIFSFFGAEIVTIAADETENPKEKIRRATNLVIYRIAIFYIFSIFFIVSLVAWNDPRLLQVGSFQRALEVLNVPGAKLIVDLVVFVAVTSCMNSGLYTASRMLYSLGARGEAPTATRYISRSGVPTVAVLMSTLAGFVGCLINYLLPGKVFGFLLSTTGAIALLVYLVIAVSQLRMRKQLEQKGQTPVFRMWLFPWLTWFVIALICSVLGYMLFSAAYRYETLMTAAVAGIVLMISLVRKSATATPAPAAAQRG